VTGFISKLAERIIAAADREHPADRILRETLKAQRDLFPEDRRAVSEAVFAWYRWRGWCDERSHLRDQVEKTMDLSNRFAAKPQNFKDEELVTRAVPAWLPQVMEVSPTWVRAVQSPPKLWLRARRGKGGELGRELWDCDAFGPDALADTLEYRGERDLFRTAAFHAGKFELQDISSQAVGLICAPGSGETWWDACTGEGGKMLHLSELMGNKGLIWASDSAAWRLQKLKRRAARAQVFNYRSVLWDGGAKLPTKTKFDGVLVDAPCSGIGTFQRNPHARWTLTAHDVEELAELQSNLLARVAAAVKPGGKLVYAVCTMTRAETTGVADAFEKQFGDFEPMPFSDPLDADAKPAPRIQYWPQDCGGAGMFVACWRKKK
jgi:16S rRNA (cytosine967-C5)-methyltransferase